MLQFGYQEAFFIADTHQQLMNHGEDNSPLSTAIEIFHSTI